MCLVLLHILHPMVDLKYLSLAGCRDVTDLAILTLCSEPSRTSLEELNLNYTTISDKGVFSMHMLSSLKQLYLGE